MGSGHKINIWEDSWIPSSCSRKIITFRGNCVLTRVHELIDPVSGAWDEALVREIFWPVDADRILQIPIYQDDTEDFVAWHLTKSGIFSVKSAYYRQWEDNYIDSNPGPMYGGGSAQHPVWAKLWSLKVPSKVKIFLWRCLHNAVPCMGVLANRHIATSGQCPICKLHAEDVSHMLFSCGRAKEIWLQLGLLERINASCTDGKSGAEVLDALLCDKANQEQYIDVVQIPEMVAVTGWYL